MPLSLSEEVSELYFQKKGYFVIRNLTYLARRPSKKQAGNLDIDILATNGREVVIVSCKRSLGSEDAEKEVKRFDLGEKLLRTDEKYKNFVTYPLRKVYVAEYVPKATREIFEQNRIEVKTLEEIVLELVKLLFNEMKPEQWDGSREKLLDGAETKVLPRMLKFLIKHEFLTNKREESPPKH